jgi:hypothetical protein
LCAETKTAGNIGLAQYGLLKKLLTIYLYSATEYRLSRSISNTHTYAKPFLVVRNYMILKLFIISCFSLLTQNCQGQNADSLTTINSFLRWDTVEYQLRNNAKWVKSKKTKTFENQGEDHSSYLALNPDSSFEFVVICEGPNHLAIGQWEKLNDSTISLIWNPVKSEQACKDDKKSSKYYKYSSFTPIDVRGWNFITRGRKLIPLKRS